MLPEIIHEHYVVFTQLLCWLAEQQSSASTRKGDNSLHKSSWVCTQVLLAVNVAFECICKNWQQVTQPCGWELPKSWQRKGRSPHPCKSSTWRSCAHAVKSDAFQQLNPFPRYFSFVLQRQSFAVWASTVTWRRELRRGRDVERRGTSGLGGVNFIVPDNVMFRQEEGQEGH